MLLLKDGIPALMTIGNRRYAVCGEACYDEDGTRLDSYCGALIDVTDWAVVRATDSCGKPENHTSACAGRTA